MALRLAVIYDDVIAVQLLLWHEDVDINRRNIAGDSVLLLAAKTYDGREPARDEIRELLVSHPAIMVDQEDQQGRSVLWHIANTSNEKLLRQLAWKFALNTDIDVHTW